MAKSESRASKAAARGAVGKESGADAKSAQSAEARRAVDLGDLGDNLGFMIRRVQLWVFRDFARCLARLDVSPAQYSVLTVVDSNPGINQLAIASALTIERAGLGRVVERLEARGLIKRLASVADRRSYVLYLTPEGRKALARMKALVQEHEERFAHKLGKPAYDQMKRLLRNFDEDGA